MPPKQGQESGISVCVECRTSVLGDLQRPGHLDSAVLPVKSLKLFTVRKFWCSGVLHQGLGGGLTAPSLSGAYKEYTVWLSSVDDDQETE